jgi:AcrR family transcriptional regulator
MDEDRRRTPSTEIRGALVDAATRLLEAQGAEALSVRRVAAEAGVAPMGVYNHFEGKNGVVDAVFRAGFAWLAEEIAQSARLDDPVDALLDGLRRYRRLALARPRTYELMFMRPVPGFEPSQESQTVALSSFDGLVQGVARAAGSGRLDAPDPAVVAQELWAACHGSVSLEMVGLCKAEDPDAAYDRLLATMLRGLAPGPARTGSRARAARPAHTR